MAFRRRRIVCGRSYHALFSVAHGRLLSVHLELVALGARVVLASRTLSKLQEAADVLNKGRKSPVVRIVIGTKGVLR